MADTTPNLSTPDAQTPSNQTPNASTHPSSAVAVMQTQSEYDNSMGTEVLLAAGQRMHDEVYDETLLAQLNQSLPLLPNPLLKVFVRHLLTCSIVLLITNGHIRRKVMVRDYKKRKSRKGVHKTMHNFLRYQSIDTLQLSFKGFNPNGVMRQIYIGFSRSCDVWHPFKTLRELLTDPSRA